MKTNGEILAKILPLAFDDAGTAILITDSDSDFLYANKAASRMTGYSNDELLNMSVCDINPEFTPEMWSEHWSMLDEYRSMNLTTSLEAKNGTVFPVEISITLIEHDGVQYDFACIRDITVHEHALQELQNRAEKLKKARIAALNMMEDAQSARREAEAVTEKLKLQIRARENIEKQLINVQKMEAVGQLSGGLAHDFNNILTVILSSAEIIDDNLDKTSPARNEIQTITNSVKHAAALTHQLMAFSRKQEHSPEIQNFNTLITDMHSVFKHLIPESIQLIEHTNCEECIVKADTGQMEQVLMNLVTNARDATPDGGTITIETGKESISQERANQMEDTLDVKPGIYATISITDTGSGIDKESALRIFEPFYTTKTSIENKGLGLSVAYGIVRQHHGFLSLYTEENHGTSFVIHLPLVKADGEFHNAPEEQSAPQKGNETILLVEDERDVRTMIARMLRGMGYTVFEATGGSDALKLFKERAGGSIDILITDLTMPEMNGTELAKRITAISPDIKILFVSGYPRTHLESTDIIEKQSAFIRKPFTSAAIGTAIRNLLNEK